MIFNPYALIPGLSALFIGALTLIASFHRRASHLHGVFTWLCFLTLGTNQ